MEMTKNAQLLHYIIANTEKSSITVLMKLCYLVDYVAFQRKKTQISDFKYQRYRFGPFDKNMYKDLEELEKEGYILHNSELSAVSEYVVYDITKELESYDKLSEEEISLVEEVLTELKGLGARTLVKIAYATPPMRRLKATIGGVESMFENLDLSVKSDDVK